MRSHSLTWAIVLVALFVLESQAADVQPSKIEIGGPRKVVATISGQETYLDVTVRMIPVHCFDTALNASLSREKAQSYALIALGRSLYGKAATITMKARGAEIVDSRTEDKRLVLTLRFPREAIIIEHAPADATTREKLNEATFNVPQHGMGLLTAKDDYLATLRALSNALEAELPSVPKEKSRADAFYNTVADCEELADRRFDSFTSEVKADKWLLTLEREEIVSSIATIQKAFRRRLREQVERFDADGVHK